MKRLLAAILVLIASSASALDNEAQANLNAAASLLAFRTLCEKPEWSAEAYRTFQQRTFEQSDLSEDATLKLILDTAFELSEAIEQRKNQSFFCSYVIESFKEASEAAQ